MKNYCHAKRALKFNNQEKNAFGLSKDMECVQIVCIAIRIESVISKVIEDH